LISCASVEGSQATAEGAHGREFGDVTDACLVVVVVVVVSRGLETGMAHKGLEADSLRLRDVSHVEWTEGAAWLTSLW
jgi:uncharacterized membrane protein